MCSLSSSKLHEGAGLLSAFGRGSCPAGLVARERRCAGEHARDGTPPAGAGGGSDGGVEELDVVWAGGCWSSTRALMSSGPRCQDGEAVWGGGQRRPVVFSVGDPGLCP